LTAAVDDELISVNPAARQRIPKPKARAARFLSPEEVERTASAVPVRDQALIHLLAYTGLRIGEAAFLRVRHLDPLRRRLRVEGAAPEVAGKRIEGATKTERSERTLVLSEDLTNELAQHVEVFGSWEPDAHLFTTEDGSPLRISNWRKRVFYPACERAGITPLPRAHDLRHTAASLAISAGAPLLAVSRMLGHSSIKVTQDVYGDLYDEDLEALASMMAEKAAAGRRGLAVRPA
jgi:integrase